MEVPEEHVNKYGIISYKSEVSKGLFEIDNVIEKPEVGSAPSRYALPGRYVFTGELFSKIRDSKPGKNGEIQLTDAMLELARSQGMLASCFQGRRFDAGDKLGYLQANIELALDRPELQVELKKYLKDLVEKI